MTWQSPLALAWLASLPILLWLWRLFATRRQVRIPSLVPFEHLLRRALRRRTRLVVNVLFWLQLAALTGLTGALAGPVVFPRQARTILVVVDTSASMAARRLGGTVFDHAKRRLLDRLRRTHSADQVFLVASAPVAAITEQPERDQAELADAVERLRVSHLPGNLATAAQIGRALLGGPVDQMLVVTDEPAPSERPADVEFLAVGEPLPNRAIVGFDAQGGFCSDASARLVVTIQSFAKESTEVRVIAEQAGRRVAESRVTLGAGQRSDVSLALPEGTEGWVDVILEGGPDALAVDNRIQVLVRKASTLPVAVVSDHAPFRQLIETWLAACHGLTWTDGLPASGSGPYVVVTDATAVPGGGPDGLVAAPAGPGVAGILQWASEGRVRPPARAHWLVNTEHPVGSYFGPVEVVAASLEASLPASGIGEPVIWGLVEGQKVPLVLAGDQEGRRTVSVFIDPLQSADSTAPLLLFFNSLRWLMSKPDVVRTGEPLVAPSIGRGPVTVERPDATVDHLTHPGGTFQYDTTTLAGSYRIRQGSAQTRLAANFLDPLESNLLERTSTWWPTSSTATASVEAPRSKHPLAKSLAAVVLALVLFEWWLYVRRKAPAR